MKMKLCMYLGYEQEEKNTHTHKKKQKYLNIYAYTVCFMDRSEQWE